MKIIGQTDEGFIINATEREIFNLIGYYYSGDTGAPKLRVGSVIDVSSMYRQLYEIKNRKGVLGKLAKELKETADLLTIKDPVINSIADAGGEK